MPEGLQQPTRILRVFLCHSSGDKPKIRSLYQRLLSDGFQPWLDTVKKTMEQNTLKRQRQDTNIKISALRDNDVILGASAFLAENYSLLFKQPAHL